MFDEDVLRDTFLKLAKELVEHIQETWRGDWSVQPPQAGTHYSYWDIKSLPSYELALQLLSSVPSIEKKYEERSFEQPIGAFLDLTVGIHPDPALLERAFEYWWDPFVDFLQAEEIPIELFVGLTNFEATQPEFRFDDETSIKFYGDRSLEGTLNQISGASLPERIRPGGVPLHRIHGAIHVEFSMPADRSTLNYHHFSHESIYRKIPIEDALRLSGFGRLAIGPWIPICNPPFPVDGIHPISSPEEGARFDEPVFILGDLEWSRFKELYPFLMKIYEDEREDIEQDRAIRRRFNSAISRFTNTFDQGYWESVLVDLVITMESLLTPERQGGRMQLALAASNLLGTNPDEVREVFDNVTEMYKLRNYAVHGEPMTQQSWNAKLLLIANNAGLPIVSLDNGGREYTFEILRDYTRRVIASMLHLFYDEREGPSGELTAKLHRLHLDGQLRNEIQSKAKAYPLSQRPEFSP